MLPTISSQGRGDINEEHHHLLQTWISPPLLQRDLTARMASSELRDLPLVTDGTGLKKRSSVVDEKVEASSTNSVELADADEALELVGVRRTAQFSEEEYAKLRKKLVGHICDTIFGTISSRVTGLDHPSAMRCSLLYPIFVSLPYTGLWACLI